MLLSEFPCSHRSPKLKVLVNGEPLLGGYEAEIISSNYFSADRFDAVIALGADRAMNECFWSSETNLLVDIQLSVSGDVDLTSVIQGFVDRVSIDAVGGVVHISGRDLTTALIAAQTQETFSNRTSSEIAAIFAQRHDLVPNVVKTVTPVGRFYQNDHESLILNRFSGATSEWDLLVYLARQEDYDAFITGKDLHFQPSVQPSALDQVLYPADMIELTMERALPLAQDIRVTVRSWNSLQQIAFTESVNSTLAGGSAQIAESGTNALKQYVVIRPNLTPDKALSVAQRCLSDLTRHERVIEFTMPGELTLSPRSTIKLEGTGTDFDQSYYINSIERTFRTHAGFIQRVRASNSSPRASSIINQVS